MKKILILALCITLCACNTTPSNNHNEDNASSLNVIGNSAISETSSEVQAPLTSFETEEEQLFNLYYSSVYEALKQGGTIEIRNIKPIEHPEGNGKIIIERVQILQYSSEDYADVTEAEFVSARQIIRTVIIDSKGFSLQEIKEQLHVEEDETEILITDGVIFQQALMNITNTIFQGYAGQNINSFAEISSYEENGFMVIYMQWNPEILMMTLENAPDHPDGYNQRSWIYMNDSGELANVIHEGYLITNEQEPLSRTIIAFLSA